MSLEETATQKVFQLSAENFEERVIRSEKPVLVDFWADWCQPCRMIAPTLEQIAVDYDGKIQVAKLNVEDHPDLAAEYGIRSIPNLILLKKGGIARQLIGVQSRETLAAAIDETVSDFVAVKRYSPGLP